MRSKYFHRVLTVFSYRSISISALSCLLPLAAADDLLRVYTLAAQTDPEFLSAEAELRVGLQARGSAYADVLPQLSLSASATETERESGTGMNLDTTEFAEEAMQLRASVPLFNVAAWQQARSGGAQADAARERYRQQKQMLVLKVADRYLKVLGAEDALEASRALQSTAQTQLANVQQRFSAGLVDVSELENARFERDNAEAVILGAEVELESARIALTAVTGREHPTLHRLRDDFREQVEVRSTDELLEIARENNPGLQAARRSYAAARSQSKGALAQSLPTLTLNWVYRETETDQFDSLPGAFGSVLPSESTDTSMSLNFNLPLYAGGRISSARRRAAGEKARLEQQLRLVETNLEQQVRILSARLASSAATVQARRQALKSASATEEAMKIRYQVGTRDILDLSRSSRALFEARRQYENSRYGHILLQLQLEQALGLLDEEDLRGVNTWLQPAR